MKKTTLLSKLIEEHYPSMRQFALAIGMPPTTLQSMMKRGIGTSEIDNVIKVCRGLGITTEDLERLAADPITLDASQGLDKSSNPRKIPVLGTIRTGTKTLATENGVNLPYGTDPTDKDSVVAEEPQIKGIMTKKELNEEWYEVVNEALSAGLDAKMMRQIIKFHKDMISKMLKNSLGKSGND